MARSAAARIIAGRYVLKAPLGRGGMGVVWRAHDGVLGREVAVKEVVFPAAMAAAERGSAQARVMREARAAARLNHPGAVTLYDVVQDQGGTFIVMELVDAPTLAELVAAGGPLSVAQVVVLGRQLAGTLEAAHAVGIVHRDVKPGNVMVPGRGVAKLADFGVAWLQGDPQLTATGLVIGSPAFMAPEQARGEESGPAADFWGLGATLFYAVEGAPPFDRGTSIATLAAVVHEPPRRPRRAGALAGLLIALLAKHPADRPTGPQLRAELDRLATRPSPPTEVLPAHGPGRTVQLPAEGPPSAPVDNQEHPAPASDSLPLRGTSQRGAGLRPARPWRPGSPTATGAGAAGPGAAGAAGEAGTAGAAGAAAAGAASGPGVERSPGVPAFEPGAPDGDPTAARSSLPSGPALGDRDPAADPSSSGVEQTRPQRDPSATPAAFAPAGPERDAPAAPSRPLLPPAPVVERRGRGRMAGVLALLVVLGLAAVLFAVTLRSGGGDDPAAAPATTAAGTGGTRASETTRPATSTTDAPETTKAPTTAAAGGLPARWTSFTNRRGSSRVGVPPGWRVRTRERFNATVVEEPSGDRRVFTVRSQNPAAPLPQASQDYRAGAPERFSEFREVSYRENQTYAGHKGAVVFEYEAVVSGRRVHVSHINLKGRTWGYNVEYVVPAAKWDASQQLARQFEQAFRTLG